jgi:L1 cell adhesion molecule like protein
MSDDAKARAVALKDQGNTLFQAGDFAASIKAFSEAIELDPTNHIFYSNRSGAYLSNKEPALAIDDAKECTRLAPSFGKGYSRLGAALVAAGNFAEAISAYAGGIAVDPTNATLTAGLIEAQRAQQQAGGASGGDDDDGMPGLDGDGDMPALDGDEAPKAKVDDGTYKGIIGIDLGTTYSCVASWDDEAQRTEVFANSEGSRTTASVVAFTETDRLVGAPAQAQAPGNPSNTVYDAKRLIGRTLSDPAVQEDIKKFPFAVVLGADGTSPAIRVNFKGEEKTFAPEEVSAMVLDKMKKTYVPPPPISHACGRCR